MLFVFFARDLAEMCLMCSQAFEGPRQLRPAMQMTPRESHESEPRGSRALVRCEKRGFVGIVVC